MTTDDVDMERPTRKWGHLHSGDSDRVWNDQHNRAGWLLIDEDGEFNRHIQKAKDDRRRARQTLWNRIGPIEIDGMRIGYRTKLWQESREAKLIAEVVDIYEDGEPYIQFRIDGTDPRVRITYDASRLSELREEGKLKTQTEIADETMEMLEHYRGGDDGD